MRRKHYSLLWYILKKLFCTLLVVQIIMWYLQLFLRLKLICLALVQICIICPGCCLLDFFSCSPCHLLQPSLSLLSRFITSRLHCITYFFVHDKLTSSCSHSFSLKLAGNSSIRWDNLCTRNESIKYYFIRLNWKKSIWTINTVFYCLDRPGWAAN